MAIVLLAATLRLGSPGMVEFKRDEANLSQLALDLAKGRSFPLLGIGSSVGVPNAPFNVYILALPYLVNSSPLTATQFIALLNVIAVVLVYWLARRYCGPIAAITASLIYTASPWAVIFSRKIWAQDMLPLFFLLTLGAGLLGFIERRRLGQAAFFPLLVITGQIHYGAFVVLPAALWLLWQGYRRRTLTRALGIGFCAAIILVIPYALGVAQASRSAGGLQTLLSSSPQTEIASKLQFTDEALRGAALMIAGTEIHSLAGAEVFQDYLAVVPDVYPLFQLLTVAVILSAVWLMVRLFRENDKRTSIDVLLLLWLIFPIVVFSFNWTPFYIHYLIPMLPAAYLVIGFAVQDAWKRLAANRTIQRIALGTGALGLTSILVFQIVLWLSLLKFLDTHATPGGFGTPLHYLMAVRDAILANQPQQVMGSL
ncbi:MAG: glycosyltransferase family 39 protein, partial [Chitinophagaceae bacterium]|nr:glycosyltransferase family 39 protein [Anaerolineae bacterium]